MQLILENGDNFKGGNRTTATAILVLLREGEDRLQIRVRRHQAKFFKIYFSIIADMAIVY